MEKRHKSIVFLALSFLGGLIIGAVVAGYTSIYFTTMFFQHTNMQQHAHYVNTSVAMLQRIGDGKIDNAAVLIEHQLFQNLMFIAHGDYSKLPKDTRDKIYKAVNRAREYFDKNGLKSTDPTFNKMFKDIFHSTTPNDGT